MIDSKLFQLLSIFIFSSIISVIMVGCMRVIAIKLQVLDHPDSLRKNQKTAVPYLGGVGIVISVLICVIIGLSLFPVSQRINQEIWFLMLPCLLIGVVGLWDDLRNLTPHFRLMTQVLLGLFCSASITFGSTTGSATGNRIADIALTIVWIVGVTNAVNFFDNFDGGAAGASLLSAIGITIHSFASGQIYLGNFGIVLIGVLVGFLFWNKNPARIYMGDAGSLFLGMLLATLVIRIEPATNTNITAFAIPILLLALPILDTSVVVVNRIRAKRSPLLGGRDHLSHRLFNLGLSHKRVLGVLALLAAFFQSLTFLLLITSKSLSYTIVAVSVVCFISLFTYFSKNAIQYD
jgi:UDP-GlcNAc:undecaprenyl-phosphate GlcNAc-1-phosphate transferase